jgi:hypothetical protein
VDRIPIVLERSAGCAVRPARATGSTTRPLCVARPVRDDYSKVNPALTRSLSLRPESTMGFLHYLNDNAGTVTAVATVVLALVTVWYVRLTHGVASFMKEQTGLLREQTKAQLDLLQQEQAQVIAAAQPIIGVSHVVRTGSTMAFSFGNDGAAARDVEITPVNFEGDRIVIPYWKKGAFQRTGAVRPGDDPLEVRVVYVDGLGVHRTKTYRVLRKGDWVVRQV